MPRLEEGDFSLEAIKQALQPHNDRLLALVALRRICEAAEKIVVNALDIDGVSDRASVLYEHLNDLNAALLRAQGELRKAQL